MCFYYTARLQFKLTGLEVEWVNVKRLSGIKEMETFDIMEADPAGFVD